MKQKRKTINLFIIILIIMIIGIVIITMKKSNNEIFITSKETQKATAPSTLFSEFAASEDISDSGNGSVRAKLEGDTLTITGTGRMKNWSNDSTPPWENDKKMIKKVVISEGITHIGANAFANCVEIEKVTIANDVTTIGDSAFFNCSKLESVNIPKSVYKIGASAFEACSKLTSIDISDNVSEIGKNAFAANRLLETISVDSGNENYSSEAGVLFTKGKTEIITYPMGKKDSFYIIPSTVRIVREYAFWDCIFLKKLIILPTVTTIQTGGIIKTRDGVSISLYLEADTEAERYAINNGLRYVRVKTWDVSENSDKTILAMLTEDGTLDITGNGRTKDWKTAADAPWETDVDIRKSIKNIIFSNGITYIGKNICANLHDAMHLTIPDSVTTIERAAFFNCRKLTEINLPANVKKIGVSAFASCDGIIEINIPASVSELGNDAVNGSSLQRIKVDDQNTMYSDKDGVLFNKDKTTLITYPSGKTDKKYEIPSSVNTIGRFAFYNSLNLRHVIVPNGVNIINEDTFCMNNKLRIITLPDTISSINSNAISNCENIYIVTENENLCAKTYALAHAKGYNVGKGWDISESSEDDVIALYSREEDMIYIRGNGYMQDWEPNTGVFSEIESEAPIRVTLDNQIENIGNYAFTGCNILAIFKKADSCITRIGNSAFKDCTEIGEIVGFKNLTTIGEQAFEGCTGLNRISIERSVTSIGDNAFKDCSENLTIITDDDNTVGAQYARDNNIKYKVKELRGITVKPQIAIIKVGETQNLAAEIEPENTYYNLVKWSSSNESIATVTNAGIVTGQATGQAIITVTSLSDESKTATAIITIEAESTPLPDDKQKPIIEKIELVNKNGKQYIYITAIDTASEIKGIEVKKDDEEYQVKKDEDGRYYFIPEKDGIYTIKVTGGNGSVSTKQYEYKKENSSDDDKNLGLDNDKSNPDKTNKAPDTEEKKGIKEEDRTEEKGRIKGEDSTKATMPIPKAGILGIAIRVLIGISLIGLIITAIKVKKYKDI